MRHEFCGIIDTCVHIKNRIPSIICGKLSVAHWVSCKILTPLHILLQNAERNKLAAAPYEVTENERRKVYVFQNVRRAICVAF